MPSNGQTNVTFDPVITVFSVLFIADSLKIGGLTTSNTIVYLLDPASFVATHVKLPDKFYKLKDSR